MAEIESPRELFVHKLGAALTMENTILGILEQLQREAVSPELGHSLRHHLQQTQEHVRNIKQAFQSLGAEPEKQPCPVAEALQKEGLQNLKAVDEQLADAVILFGVVETEAYEIAVYDGLITNAEAMGEHDLVALFEENLEQEQQTLQKARKAMKQLTQRVAVAV